ncbi:MAG: SDR family NAD(P)-dependent oxidoreductase [Myxococcota bacterium]
MSTLSGRIAVVTGATRGIGRGVAMALGEQGATVYVSGRTVDGDRSIDAAAKEVTQRGGEGRAVRCDHGNDADITALFARVKDEAGRLDVLVNNVYKVPDKPAWGGGFWEHPVEIWDDQVGIGLRAHYVASWHAAPLLFASERAAVFNISSPGGESYHFSASYGAGKAGLDRLTKDMAQELQPKGVPAVVIYPGVVSTEFIVDTAKHTGMDLSQAQSPLLVGRCVNALLASDDLMERTGTIQWVEDVAEEFDVRDENGARPTEGYPRRVRT